MRGCEASDVVLLSEISFVSLNVVYFTSGSCSERGVLIAIAEAV